MMKAATHPTAAFAHHGRAACVQRPTAALVVTLVSLLGWSAGPGAASARAHEFWLSPATYQPAPAETVAVQAFTGTGFRGELKPYTLTRVVRLDLVGWETVDLSRSASTGDLVFARFAPPDDGGALVVYQSIFTYLDLPGDRFGEYLLQEGLDNARSVRDRDGQQAEIGHERYRRCAKAWLAGRDPSRAQQRVDLPLEIVPLADPSKAKKLPVLVLWDGKPLEGALLKAWRQALDAGHAGAAPRSAATRDSVPPVFRGRTDRTGKITVSVDQPGEWMLNTVHMEPSADDQAQWESTWASFTFARKRR
jgi:hypothetical protein